MGWSSCSGPVFGFSRLQGWLDCPSILVVTWVLLCISMFPIEFNYCPCFKHWALTTNSGCKNWRCKRNCVGRWKYTLHYPTAASLPLSNPWNWSTVQTVRTIKLQEMQVPGCLCLCSMELLKSTNCWLFSMYQRRMNSLTCFSKLHWTMFTSCSKDLCKS